LAATFFDEGIHKLVNVVTTALFCIVTMRRRTLAQVPTFCNKNIFKNYLNIFYNQQVLTVWKRYVSSS